MTTLTKQSRERLLRAADLIEALPPEKKLTMNIWHACGTSGCIAGWCGLDPWFRRQGLKTTPNGKGAHNLVYTRPHRPCEWNMRACEKFFSVGDDVYHLFGPGPRHTRRTAAQRLRRFVREQAA